MFSGVVYENWICGFNSRYVIISMIGDLSKRRGIPNVKVGEIIVRWHEIQPSVQIRLTALKEAIPWERGRITVLSFQMYAIPPAFAHLHSQVPSICC
jgi:hypothetical protein